MLIDSHCHLEMKQFQGDYRAAVGRARAQGVERVVSVGTNLSDARRAVAIADELETVFAAAGVHPHDAKDADENTYAALRELAQHPKVLAYGEIGLDFFKNYSPREVQIAAFRRQLRLARELDLPLIIHDRDAHQECLEILRAEGGPYRGVFHCFAGDRGMAEQLFQLGFLVSFTGTITYAKPGQESETHRVIRECPADRFMIETDAPYLTPHPHRKERNEPAYVRLVAETVAALRGTSLEEVARCTSDNAYRLFRFETKGLHPAIVYRYHDALYINLTSRCSNNCLFCIKHPNYLLGSHYLRLEREQEPSVADVLEAVGDPSRYPEIVFCGMGEPTLRWNDLIAIARALKRGGAKRVRLNTNGQAELLQNRPLAREMHGVLDAVSVSLNAHDAKAYNALCQPAAGERAFAAILDFIGQARRYVPEVVASAVNLPEVDLPAVRHLAERMLGVPLRIR